MKPKIIMHINIGKNKEIVKPFVSWEDAKELLKTIKKELKI